MATTPRISVFDRVLDPLTECLTPEAARRITDQRGHLQLENAYAAEQGEFLVSPDINFGPVRTATTFPWP